jgi:hypothetical protein
MIRESNYATLIANPPALPKTTKSDSKLRERRFFSKNPQQVADGIASQEMRWDEMAFVRRFPSWIATEVQDVCAIWGRVWNAERQGSMEKVICAVFVGALAIDLIARLQNLWGICGRIAICDEALAALFVRGRERYAKASLYPKPDIFFRSLRLSPLESMSFWMVSLLGGLAFAYTESLQ